MAPPRVHHSAICTGDVDASLRFWRDGIGLQVLMDRSFTGDWPTLFDAPAPELRAIFLGDPAAPDAGIVELVTFPGDVAAGPAHTTAPVTGFFLLSLFVDVDAVLGRLRELGVGGEPRMVTTSGVRMVAVRDPNGVVVELLDAPAAANLRRLSDP